VEKNNTTESNNTRRGVPQPKRAAIVNIKDDQKKVKIPTGIRMIVRRCCNAVLITEKFDRKVEVSVCFVDDDIIRGINNEYRGVDESTDVLSFPLIEDSDFYEDGPDYPALGDIVISAERAAAQAQKFGHSFKREMGYLTVHAMLHMLGYDHTKSDVEAVRMREKEEVVLNLLGLPRVPIDTESIF